MVARAGEAIHLRAVFEANRDPAAARGLYELFDTFAVTPAGDDDAIECAARFEGLADGVNAGKTAHMRTTNLASVILNAETQSPQR